MNPMSTLEARVAALISDYADRAPIEVDPMAMTRSVATSATRGRWPTGLIPAARGLALVMFVLALLATMVAGVLVTGGQPFRRDPPSIVDSFAEFRLGWVFVYEDGRVIWYPDNRAYAPKGMTNFQILERRMTPAGLDLVRSGAVHPSEILYSPADGGPPAKMPAGTWADAEIRAYEPTNYAVCLSGTHDGSPRDVGRLPAPAQALLRGKERTYEVDDPLSIRIDPVVLGVAVQIVGCWEVTPEEARILVDLLGDAGFTTDTNGPAQEFLDAGSEGGAMYMPAPSRTLAGVDAISVRFQPIFPHGTWMLWGG